MRSRDSGSKKLLLSARANSPRINITSQTPENPQTPPMLCMLLRKRLAGARLREIRQPELERILFLDFEGKNELGDTVMMTLAVEIMAQYSNVIFIDGEGMIIDALKRVDPTMSSKRLVHANVRTTSTKAECCTRCCQGQQNTDQRRPDPLFDLIIISIR